MNFLHTILRRIGTALLASGGAAWAQVAPAPTTLPQGGQVMQGRATLQNGGSAAAPVLNVNQTSQRAVIDWTSFDLGAAGTVNFNQPNTQSATLNRVQQMNASEIFGHLNATGQVTLVNPAGVYFSPGAVLDVGALTATTMQQSDADFMAGKASFTRSGSTASVVNDGTLQARLGGYVALLAPEVRNEGLIVAQQGTVALASGEAIRLNFDAASHLASLTVTPAQIATLVENRTAVQVGGGQILLSATAVSGLTGSVINSGQLNASSLVAKGGRIVLEGDAVTLAGTSTIDATGAAGGGTVLVGGDWQGASGTYQATTTTMAKGARIDASATQQGDGGKVVLWSDVHQADSITTAQGSIVARGGAAGGNGGRIETSGHQAVIDGLAVDAGAANGGRGAGGLWLIDPSDSTITQTVANGYATTLNTGTSVTDDVAGNITWNSGVSLAKTAGGNATLTLRTTGGSIALNGASITSSSGALNLALWTRYGNEGNEGRISLSGSTINTNGGNVWMGGGNTAGSTWNGMTVGDERASTYSANQQGVDITGTSIATGAGSMQIKGLSNVTGSNTGTNDFGVWIDAGSSLTTTSGSIALQGDAQGTYTNGLGVLVGTRSTAGNVMLASTSGAINITGTATDQSGSGTGWRHGEMLVANNAGDQITVRSTSGAITLNGAANSTSSAFTTDSSGVQLQVGTTTGGVNVVSQTGAISLLGSAALEGSNQTIDAIRFSAANVANSIRIGYDGINAYSGNILLQGDSILQMNQNAGAGSLAVQTSGTLTFQSAGNAFTYLRSGSSGTLSFDDDWNFGTTLSGFTFGKTTNTLDLSLSSPLTVAGGVDITAGNLTVNGNISKTSGGDATLTMRATGDINFAGAGINATSGKLNTVLISDWDSANGGAIYLNGSGTPITINTNGGQFWAGGNGYAAAYGSALWNGLTVGAGTAVSFATTSVFEGVNLNRVALNTGGGNVAIAGRNNRYNSGEDRYGVRIQNGSSINTGSGSIAVNGSLVPQSGSLASQPVIYGVSVANSTLQTTTGGISLSGSEGATDVNYNTGGYGIQLYDSTVKTTGSSGGNITLSGITGTDPGGSTTNPRYGVQLFADGASQTTQVSSVAGNIAITGTANVNGSNSTSAGVQFTTRQPTNADATNPVVKVVSQTGNVTLAGNSPNNPNTGSSGIGFDGTDYGKLYVGYDGTSAYSGTTTLTGSGVIQANMATGYLALGGSGGLVIEPSGNNFVTGTSTAQSLTFDTSWNFGSSHSSIRLGKDIGSTGHADSITVSNALGAAGPISLYSGNVNLNANLSTTAAGAGIVAKASGNVIAASGEVLQTNGGAITLWADSDGSGAGYILLNDNSVLDSRTASDRGAGNTSTASGGGAITLGGGAALATGYATSANTNDRGGINFGDQTVDHNNANTIYSGGGAIVLRGQSTGNMMGINWTNSGTVNAGSTGTVQLTGVGTGTGHGIELGAWQAGGVTMTAGGGSSSSAAISLNGTAASGGGNGLQSSGAVLQATGAGGITLNGSAAASGSVGVTGGFDLLAASGPIAVNGGTLGINIRGTMGAKSATAVTASSSNISLTGDTVAFGSSATVATSGTLTVQPYSNNFSSALNWPLSNLSLAGTVSGLTLGKDIGSTAHTDTITVGSATSIAGPIKLYAGTINLNANLTSTLAGAGILAKASGSITSNAGRTFQTNNGDLIFWSNASNGGTAGALTFGDSNTFNTANGSTSQSSGGGRIVMAGGFDDGSNGGTASDGVPDGFASSSATSGITFGTSATAGTTSLYSGGGNVLLRGNSTFNGGLGITWDKVGVVNAGNGTVGMTGTATQSHGIELGAYSGSTTITAGGGDATHAAITIVGTTTSTSSIGIQTNSGTMQATGTGGITVTGTTDSSSSTPANNLGMDVLSASGPIAITAIGGTGLRYGGILGKRAGSSVTASSANVTLTGDALAVNNGITVDTTGTLIVQPYSASFGSALAWGTGITVAPTVSGLTLGKAGNTADITVGTAQSIAGPVTVYGGAVTVNQNLASSAGGDITVFADTLAFGASGRFTSAGNLNIAPTTAGRSIGLGGATGLLALAATDFTTDFVDGFASINLGNASSGKITSAAITASDNLVLRSGSGGIEVTGALNVGANTLGLNSSGAISESGSGAVVASKAWVVAGGNVAMNGSGNDVGTLAGSGGSFGYLDSNALTIGSVASANGIQATGTVSVATATGDLSITQNVATSDASSAAIVLNAGQASAAGTASGGNLVLSGSPAITTGAGGRATLYTGSIAGSTSVGAFVGSGSGRFRYDSDEANSNFSAALSSGAFAIYREQPTLAITIVSPTLTYGDTLPTLASVSGAVNGDALGFATNVGGTTSSSGHYSAGSHAINGSSSDATALGYAVSAPAGTLTVTPKALTISGIVAADKTYDGNVTASVDTSGAAYAGLLSGDVVSVTATGSFADKNVGTAKPVTLTSSHVGADAGDYTFTDQGTTSADITPKALTVSGSSAVDKTYDRTTGAALTGGSLVGVIGSDAVTLAQGGSFASVDVGTAISVTASDSLGGTGAGNYTLTQPTGLRADITPKALTVTGSVAADKVYDRGTLASLSGGTLQGVMAGDSLTLTQAGAFASANAGTGIAVTASDSLGGISVGNYALTQPTGLSADITPKALTVIGSVASNKVYDRTTGAGISGGVLQGVIAGDTLTLIQAGDFASANAGTGIAVTANDTLGGAAGNYTLTQPTGLVADITPKALTVTGSVAADKVYDRSTLAGIGGGTLQGVIAGDTLTLTQAGAFVSANVGTNIAVIASDSLGGGAAGNYTLTQPTGLGADITPKALTVIGSVASNKVYDRTTGANVNGGSLQGVVAGDALTLTQAGDFASANAGNGIAVTASDTLGGSAAGNYTLAQPTGLSADITPKALSVTGSAVANKVYDRTTTASVDGGSLQGVIAGDTLTLTQAGAFVTANVGTGIAVITSDSLAGGAAGNYSLTQPTGLSADITPKALTVTGSVAANKVYDRSTTAGIDGGALQGVVTGDVLTLTQAGHFATVNAGTGITVTASDALGGSAAGNYTLAQPTGLSADITPKPLTVTGSVAANKVYDRTTYASIGGGSLQGVIAGDAVALTQTGAFVTADAGTGIAVIANDSLNGAAGNYTLTQPSGLSADITPKALTVTGSVATGKVYDRTTTASVSGGALQGVIAGDSVTLAQAADFVSANAGIAVPVITSDSLGGSAAGNYTVTQPTGLSADITPKALTVTGSVAANKVYDRTTTAIVSGGTLQGVIAGDALTLTQAGSFASANAGNGIAVNANDSLTGSASGNYSLTQPTGLAADITPKALTVSGSDAANKVYDRNTIATISGGTLVGVIGGDNVGLTQAGSFASANAGIGIAVNANDGLTGSASGNYTLIQPTSLAADITPKALTVSGSDAANKVYDRNTIAVLSGGTLVGVIGGDNVGLTQAGNFASANAGNGIAVNANDGLTGSASGNYTLIQPTSLAADITPKSLTVSGSDAANKVYDRNTIAVLSGGTLVGVIGGDNVGLTQAGAFASANAGNGIAVSASDSLTGSASGNYTLIQPSSLTADITPKALTVSGSDAANKVYDRNTIAVLSGGTLVGVIGGDNVGLTQAGNFASANAGNGIAVNASDNLTGASAGNYTLVQPTGIAADIAPKALTVAGSLVATKVYDRSTTASISGATLDGVIDGDAVTLTQAGTFASPHAGTGIAVVATDSLGGNAAANYALTQPTGLSGDITPRPLALQGGSGLTKTYDGKTDLPVNGTAFGALAGVLPGDVVQVQGTPTYAAANAGAEAIVQGSVALGGAAAGDYRLAWANGSGTITPAPLIITANNDARFVTQADAPGYDGASYTGFVDGETAAALRGTLRVVRSNAGTNAAARYADVLVASGLSSSNYAITFAPGSYTIVPANELLVRVSPVVSTYGAAAGYVVSDAKYLASDNTTIVDLTGSVAVQGGKVSLVDGAGGSAHFTLTPLDPALSGAGLLKVGSYQLGASGMTENSANFSDALVVVGTEQVVPKAITLATSGATKVYDGSSSMSGLHLGANGIEAGDTVAAAGSGAFSSRNAGTGLAYSISGIHLEGADAGNYSVISGSTLNGTDGVITPKPVTLVAPTASRVYDGSTVYLASAAQLAALGLQLGVSGDSITSIGLAFDDKNVSSGRTLTGSGAVIADGNGGANYRVSYVADHQSSITRLASVTWVGGSSGNWFDPSNWAGGAVPDLANVANVVIPANVTVTFGDTIVAPASSGPVQIDGLGRGGALTMQSGQLIVGSGGIQLDRLTQSGGALSSQGDVALGAFGQAGGSFDVDGAFSTVRGFQQTGNGSLVVGGATNIGSTAGGVVVGNLTSGGTLTITSTGGPITQQTGTTVIADGDTRLSASENGAPAAIVLDGPTDHFAGAVTASGSTVDIPNGPDPEGQAQGSQGASAFGAIVASAARVDAAVATRVDASANGVAASHAAIGLSLQAPGSNVAVASPGIATVVQLKHVDADAIGLILVQIDETTAQSAAFAFELTPQAAEALRKQASPATAERADGQPLPIWLAFDAERMRFVAKPAVERALPIDVIVRSGERRVLVRIALGVSVAGA